MSGKKALKTKKGRPGFTLTELLVAMGIAAVVLTSVTVLFSKSNKSYINQDKQVEATQTARAALDIMAYEFRMAGYLPLENVSGGTDSDDHVIDQGPGGGDVERISEATDDAITFLADINGDDDDATVDNAEAMRYWFDAANNTVWRNSWTWDGSSWNQVAGGQVPLAENVEDLTYSYVFADGSTGMVIPGDPAKDYSDVRGINVSLTVRTRSEVSYDGGTSEHKTRTLTSNVRMRNMGLKPVAQ
jgi:prepilin-type N-terminal cleavage/methylation domain-containing protein